MKLINLTPHEIVLNINGVEKKIEPSGIIARCNTIEEVIGSINIENENMEIPLIKVKFTEPTGIPPEQDGVLYIVSQIVKQNSARIDLVVPDTGKTCIRDEKGNIIAVTRLLK